MTYQHQSGHDAVDAQEPIPSHSMVEHETHITHYPDHPDRKESALYKQTHHALCVEQDAPCFVCGFRHSQATDRKRTTETHHVGVEWAFQGAVDWHKFKAKMQILADLFGKLAAIDPEAAKADPTSVVDGPLNMLVLCSDCHRSPFKGIHHVPLPEWLLQAFAVDGYTVLEATEGGHA